MALAARRYIRHWSTGTHAPLIIDEIDHLPLQSTGMRDALLSASNQRPVLISLQELDSLQSRCGRDLAICMLLFDI